MASRTIKISKEQIRRRKMFAAWRAFFARLADFVRRRFRPRQSPAATAKGVIQLGRIPGNGGVGAGDAAKVTTGIGLVVETKVKNCPACHFPLGAQQLISCRSNVAHRVHRQCYDLVGGVCPLDGHALG